MTKGSPRMIEANRVMSEKAKEYFQSSCVSSLLGGLQKSLAVSGLAPSTIHSHVSHGS